ncbi:extracellular proline-serine rich protein [Colletotrichum falcatum]|nr:extracellular proline-serine rich protein [Colletotrichum falcatum]
MRFFTAALALAAPLVSAIDFSSPTVNSTIAKGSKYELTWNTVDTDPSTFSVFLVNFVNWPPFYTLLAENIETSAGAASIDVPCSVQNSYGYQFNAINGTNVYVIYAQTPKFSISGADCAGGPTTLPPALPSTCAPPSTVTVTVSKTLSKNSTAAATGGIPAAQSKITTAAVSATPAPVFHGTCPDIIGWASDYHHPVTLTKPPQHPDNTAFALPTKAPYPIGGDDDDDKNVTSTIYRTTYLPLEMAPTGACFC